MNKENPLVAGGQGRSESDIDAAHYIVTFCAIGIALVIAITVLCR